VPSAFDPLTRTGSAASISHINVRNDVFGTLSEREALALAPMILSPSEVAGAVIKNRNDFLGMILEVSEVIVRHVPRGYSCRIGLILENNRKIKLFLNFAVSGQLHG
jgi:hypothetical protein